MARIFISYRRGESSPYARMVFDSLSRRFGEANVFYDHKAIEPGLDFRTVIREELHACDALIALIGQQWLVMKNPDGARRIDDPADIVHQEIATALGRDIRVIPVLVQDVGMPKEEELPRPLAALSYRNALELTDAKWEYDQQRLIEILQKVFDRGQPKPPEPPPPHNTPSVEVLLKKALLCKTEADELFAEDDTEARVAKLQQAYGHLRQANEIDPTDTQVLLEMARLLMELTPDDSTDEAKLLRRVKKLLANPAGATERFHLAQATFLLATASKPIDTDAIEEARDLFDDLGKRDWVRQCDAALKSITPPDPSPQPKPPPLPLPPQPPPGPVPPTVPDFFGRWNIEIMAVIKNSMVLDLFSNGTCQGTQQLPLLGAIPFQGNWAYDPYSRTLQLQCMMQFQPFALGIIIQAPHGTGYQGVGTDGCVYLFNRV